MTGNRQQAIGNRRQSGSGPPEPIAHCPLPKVPSPVEGPTARPKRPPLVFIGLAVHPPPAEWYMPPDASAAAGLADVYRGLSTPDAVRAIQPRGPVVMVPKPKNIRTAAMAPPGAAGRRKKIGRNDPCPCGSGKKFKACHLPQAVAAANRRRARP